MQHDPITYHPMSLADHPEAYALWQATPGVGVSLADERAGVERYLARNPNMSFVARLGGRIIGTLMAGHDGRRGYMFHLAVAPEFRNRGIARELVNRSLAALKADGIERTHILVYSNNASGRDFWAHLGWQRIDFMDLFSINLISPGKQWNRQ
ncbi:GNAT family N-acetyltransferase [bacterium]|nr:GNAT family N-acetyltransferase [bacterium]